MNTEEKILKQFREKFTSKDAKNITENGIPFTDYWKTEDIESFLRSTITSIQREMIEKIIELVQQNHKGTFTDDGGNDCWYIDDLVKALEHYKDSLQSPLKEEEGKE